MKSRKTVEEMLSKFYSQKFKGKVWAMYDPQKRKYSIQGECLPPADEMKHLYPNGWSLLDYIEPCKAQKMENRP